MKLTNFTINKVYPLLQGVNSQGESWQLREIILVDESHEYGDAILCRMRGEQASNFALHEGDKVDAYVDFRTREYTNSQQQTRPTMEARCWKMDQPTR